MEENDFLYDLQQFCIRACIFCAIGIVSYVVSFFAFTPIAPAANKKCWKISHEISDMNEVVYYLNTHDVDSSSYLLHNFRNGIRWYVVYQTDCGK